MSGCLRGVALMLTRRCNIACGHCSVESNPRLAMGPTEAQVLERLDKLLASGTPSIILTGGEPMLREPLVMEAIARCRRAGTISALVSNGFWGRQRAAAEAKLDALFGAGLDILTLSWDRYHAEHLGAECVEHIARAAHARDRPVQVSVTRGREEEPALEALRALGDELGNVELRLYDIQPVGLARELELRGETEGFCAGAAIPAVGDDGRVTTCNGPSYFMGDDSPLVLGQIDRDDPQALLTQHRDDPYLDAIRLEGPARMLAALRTLPGFEDTPVRDRYAGICAICHQLASDPAAVEALRAHYASPAQAVRRVALAQLVSAGRVDGALDRETVNGERVARVLLRAARADDRESAWTAQSRTTLGRADLDWNRLATTVIRNGLAGNLLRRANDPELARWAPASVLDAIRQQAMRQAMRELTMRELLEQIAATARALGSRPMLLKGGAQLARWVDGGAVGPRPRATGDLDLLLPAGEARRLWRALREGGFQPVGASNRLHLAPLERRGVEVELHTRLLPRAWGYPERELLGEPTALGRDPRLIGLLTPSASAELLHAAAHSAMHLFGYGLKAAWDIARLLDEQDARPLSWAAIDRWCRRSAAPAAATVTLRQLEVALELGLPPRWLAQLPGSPAEPLLRAAARGRLLSSADHSADENPISRLALHLLLQRRPAGAAIAFATWLGDVRRAAGAPAEPGDAGPARPSWRDHASQAWRHAVRLRRALRRRG